MRKMFESLPVSGPQNSMTSVAACPLLVLWWMPFVSSRFNTKLREAVQAVGFHSEFAVPRHILNAGDGRNIQASVEWDGLHYPLVHSVILPLSVFIFFIFGVGGYGRKWGNLMLSSETPPQTTASINSFWKHCQQILHNGFMKVTSYCAGVIV